MRLGFVLSLICVLTACDGDSKANVAALVQSKAAAKPTYANEVQKLSAAIEHGLQLHVRQPSDNLVPLEVVSLYQERARLTGNYDDYTRAEDLLASLLKGEKQPSTQCLARARLHYTLHRLKQAAAALDGCATTVESTEIAALRADISMYSGRYRDAESAYRALVNDVGISSHYVRLGLLKKWLGDPGEAAALFEAAEKRYHGSSPMMRAWLKLQRGSLALDRGRLEEALALYNLASDELSGWWLIDEQIAEVKRLSGDTMAAKALYEEIINHGAQPEHMDELARLLREGTSPEAANGWIERAESIYRERLKRFPEASVGHAVDHFLQFGTPTEALALAQKNATLRPYGVAQIALAAALFRAGQAGAAADCIARVEASGWNTAQLHAIAAQINAGLGRASVADLQHAMALRMNPNAMRLYPLAPPVQPEIVSML
ncbi:MAG: hypothetical protein ABI583_10340 [Betaproteobacteria bacterium]